MKKQVALKIIVWTVFLFYFGLGYYVNHYLPHGPSFSTGDVVCQNDGRGPCGESYIEEVRDLKIPEWAKFIKRSEGTLLLYGLLLLAIVVSVNNDKN